jgi:hypothetical protein
MWRCEKLLYCAAGRETVNIIINRFNVATETILRLQESELEYFLSHKKRTVLLKKKLSVFIEPENSFQCSENPATGP